MLAQHSTAQHSSYSISVLELVPVHQMCSVECPPVLYCTAQQLSNQCCWNQFLCTKCALWKIHLFCPAAEIRGWWIWLYWISPLSCSVRSLALNEFTTVQWSAPYEFDPAISIGDASLATFGVQTGYWWVWLGVGVLAAYAIMFNIITTLALTYLSRECRTAVSLSQT